MLLWRSLNTILRRCNVILYGNFYLIFEEGGRELLFKDFFLSLRRRMLWSTLFQATFYENLIPLLKLQVNLNHITHPIPTAAFHQTYKMKIFQRLSFQENSTKNETRKVFHGIRFCFCNLLIKLAKFIV